MVLIGDVDVVTGPDVVADLDALVADDADALAEHAAVADRDDRFAALVRMDGHPGRDAGKGADRAARADRDATFAEDHRRREGDHAAVAEVIEAPRLAVARPDRADPHDAIPTRMDDVAGDPP